MQKPSPNGILAALDNIDPLFLDSPLRASAELDAILGAVVQFKDETANPIRSFKGRGACNYVFGLGAERPLVCGSAGNFGQGMAWAARDRGVPLTVFAAVDAVDT